MRLNFQVMTRMTEFKYIFPLNKQIFSVNSCTTLKIGESYK